MIEERWMKEVVESKRLRYFFSERARVKSKK
jgi:hypothetical protein